MTKGHFIGRRDPCWRCNRKCNRRTTTAAHSAEQALLSRTRLCHCGYVNDGVGKAVSGQVLM